MVNGVPNIVFKFFSLKKPIPFDLNQKNRFWGHIFPHICGFIGPIVSKNNRVHPWVDPHQPCEFHENRTTATCIVTSYTYIYIYTHTKVYEHCGFVINDLQNEKRDHPHLPYSPPSEVKGVRIVVISFRNITKKSKYDLHSLYF